MKKVRVIKSFVAITPDGKVRASEGDIIDMPDGVDWLPAGFVELVVPEKPAADNTELGAEASTKRTKGTKKKK